MAKIDEEIAAIEAKLKQAKAKKQKMEAATKAAEAKALRASLTQRKIILGAFLLDLMSKNADYERQFMQKLSGFLTRDKDRKAFGFEPLTAANPAPAPQSAPPTPAPQQAAAPRPAPETQQAPAAEKPIIYDRETILRTEFTDRDAVKALGAKWHADERKWCVPAGVDVRPFARWIP